MQHGVGLGLELALADDGADLCLDRLGNGGVLVRTEVPLVDGVEPACKFRPAVMLLGRIG
jgi:hypothetical protein